MFLTFDSNSDKSKNKRHTFSKVRNHNFLTGECYFYKKPFPVVPLFRIKLLFLYPNNLLALKMKFYDFSCF